MFNLTFKCIIRISINCKCYALTNRDRAYIGFINVGYEDGANDETIKEFIMKHAKDVEAGDFADVYVRGTFSFFEIPKDLSKSIIDSIEGTHYGEKLMHVEKTDRDAPNPKKAGKKPSDFHRSENHSHSYGSNGGYHKGYKKY